MSKMHPNTLAGLRLIAAHGPIATAMLKQLAPFDGSSERCKRAVQSLKASGLVDHLTPAVGDLRYAINAAGKRFLRALAQNQTADNPAPPRESRVGGHYDGRDLRAYTARPGALDAFRLPSLQGEHIVPRARPVSLASRQDVRGFRG
jgi:hypothetical protein